MVAYGDAALCLDESHYETNFRARLGDESLAVEEQCL